MKKAALVVLCLTLAAGIGFALHHYTAIPKKEGVAHLKSTSPGPSTAAPLGAGFIEKSAGVSQQRPDSILDLPTESFDGIPLYFAYAINDANFPGVIYRGEKEWTIYADTNLNGKLSDEKGIKGRARIVSNYRTDYIFGPVLIENAAIPQLYLVYSGYVHISLFPAAYQTGKIRLHDSVHQVALLDGDLDTKYVTLFTPDPDSTFCLNCDVLAIDLNRDKIYQREERLPLSRYVRINAAYYEVCVSEQGDRLDLQKASPALGQLKIGGQKSLACLLYSKTLSGAVYFTDELQLPAGEYSAHYGVLEIRDNKGIEWRFVEEGFGRQGALKQFVITADQVNEQPLGPPFRIKTDRDYRRSGEITFRVLIEGAGRETYSARIYKNGISPPEPTVRIVEEQGNTLHSGTMEYG